MLQLEVPITEEIELDSNHASSVRHGCDTRTRVGRERPKTFGDLDEIDIGAAIQLKAIDVDLIRSNNHPLFRAALQQTRTVGEWKVPRTEVLVVLKFLAAVSPTSDREKRTHDVGDIIHVYRKAGGTLDRARMVELSKLIDPGAEREFSELLDKIDRNESIAI